MITKFSGLLFDAKQNKYDVVLLFQSLVFLTILTMLGRISITLLYLLKCSLGLWFYWLYLKNGNLLRKIKSINTAIIDDLKNTIGDIPATFKTWKPYLSRAIGVSFSTFIITFIVFKFMVDMSAKDKFLFVVFINVLVYFISRFLMMKRFIADIVNVYTGKSVMQISELKKPPNLVKLFIQGFLAGLLYLIVIYKAFEMSLIHYFLHYFAFGGLVSLSLGLMAMYRHVFSAIEFVDFVRTNQVNG